MGQREWGPYGRLPGEDLEGVQKNQAGVEAGLTRGERIKTLPGLLGHAALADNAQRARPEGKQQHRALADGRTARGSHRTLSPRLGPAGRRGRRPEHASRVRSPTATA